MDAQAISNAVLGMGSTIASTISASTRALVDSSGKWLAAYNERTEAYKNRTSVLLSAVKDGIALKHEGLNEGEDK